MITFLCQKTQNPETMLATKNSVCLVNKKLYKSARQKTVEEHKAAKAVIPAEEEEDSKGQSH
jgi:hypothetical protein